MRTLCKIAHILGKNFFKWLSNVNTYAIIPEIRNERKEKSTTTDTVQNNLERTRARIAAAAWRAGHDEREITLVAVAKNKPAQLVEDALRAGVGDIGENYIQEGVQKRSEVTGAARWHFLGHLQSNKAKLAAANFDLIQSVDSLLLAVQIGRHAEAAGKTQAILLQVHLGDEASKFGVPPDQVADLATEMAAAPGIALCGLMGIAPFGLPPRPFFQQMRRLYEALPAPNRQQLSMGMTADFETAIEEGATLIRLGTAVFGAR